MHVLFVDNDKIIRKLFCRAIKTVGPGWTVSEASNGEVALKMAEETEWEMTFLDNYTASTKKQLLGTETARAIRAKGFGGIICGLSANDLEAQ